MWVGIMPKQSITVEIHQDGNGKAFLILSEWDMTIRFESEDDVSGSEKFMKIFATNTAQALKRYWEDTIDISVCYKTPVKVIEHG